jgi:hypothetical protein
VHQNQMGNTMASLVWSGSAPFFSLNGQMRASACNMWRLHCVAGVVACVGISKTQVELAYDFVVYLFSA